MNHSAEQPDRPDDRPWLLDLRPAGALDDAQGASAEVEGRSSGLPPDTLGVALSGGGVHAAAFCLGLIQAMARADWLRHVDFLSTASGGGYIGAFLGRYFDTFRKRPGEPELTPGAIHQRVARTLNSQDSVPVRWLRNHSSYPAAAERSGVAANFAASLRDLPAIYLVLGVTVLGLFGILNAVSYSPWVRAQAMQVDGLIFGFTPITRQLLPGLSGLWPALTEILLWLVVAPLMIARWLASHEQPEAFNKAALLAAAFITATLTYLTRSALPLTVLAAAVFCALWSWGTARRFGDLLESRSFYRLTLAQDILNRRLTAGAGVLCAFAAFSVVDALGSWLYQRMLKGAMTERYIAVWILAFGVAALGSAVLLRTLAATFAAKSHSSTFSEAAWRRSVSATALLLAAFISLVGVSFLSHYSYEAGRAYAQGVTVTAVALIVSLFFGSRECVALANRSSVLGTYAGYLGRTFLGAVNPIRHSQREEQDATRPSAGDDLSLASYRPHETGGPLHLINCAVHSTRGSVSNRRDRGREVSGLTVGPVAISVARDWHAYWTDRLAPAAGLTPNGADPTNPFVSRSGGSVPAEPLTLQDWMAISGSQSSSRAARDAKCDGSRLGGVANPHSGYWWDSGLDPNDRTSTIQRSGYMSKVGHQMAKLFRTQLILLLNLTGRVGGLRNRHWYLSGGGDVDATGAYELLRRRLPFVVVCDASEGPERCGADLAQLVRHVRIHLGAEVTEASADPVALRINGVPQSVADHIGALIDLLPSAGGCSPRHAALLQVRYPEGPSEASSDPWLSRRLSWILYIRATLTGDEPADVREYAREHPAFPHETRVARELAEHQWESYRKLGEHIGGALFIPLMASACPCQTAPAATASRNEGRP